MWREQSGRTEVTWMRRILAQADDNTAVDALGRLRGRSDQGCTCALITLGDQGASYRAA
jgi:hypothetical protein